MKVQELIEKLQQAPADSEVGFCWFGNHTVSSVEIGHMPAQGRGYVLLHTGVKTRSSREGT
jgi:hypothetical protein